MATEQPRPLRDLLQTLPQELYDEIFEQTFTADDSIRKLNTATKKRVLYKSSSGTIFWRDEYFHSNFAAFPSSLHVSRSTRAQFAKSYYGQGAFIVAHDREAARTSASVKNALRNLRMRVQFAQDFRERMNFEIEVVESIATKLGVPVKKLVDTLGL
ncbi:hypothetical protein AC579_8596 [Pseudocercospora musae]|uniref:F-box domain-containing protein n=1 Tax=Pseudocercospora musae TaxID=113226 RepID=A0A139HZR3_9PEZI|nr:hypothetical protein AC579_8596 [Pseudocercospora musae]